jgi:uncharacterized protein YbaR (Trm112 family)/ubiquinone/menaquinone biosynthesis C-methylase UbiE
MKERLLTFLCCPSCRGDRLELHDFTSEGEHVLDGALRCEGCGRLYLIADGVPRMLSADLYANPGFETRHRSRLQAIGWSPPPPANDEYAGLKLATSYVYGFEWTHWGRYGWQADGTPTEEERATFHHKSLLGPKDLAGAAVLDAGCGNGRYLHTAAQYAKDAIGLDLSAAADSAFRNLRHLPAAHVVQGDILNPPIRDGVLDAVYSIGVLMITGDTKLATKTLARTLKPGGTITVHVYAAGFPLWQFNDWWVRKVTTRLSIPAMMTVSKRMTQIARFLKARRMHGYASLVLRIYPDDTHNFDWFATPLQTYHTYPEMRGWFREMGFEVIADNERKLPPETSPLRRKWIEVIWPEAMTTVRARVPLATSNAVKAAAGS